jgi:hypothetical protein
MLETIYVRLQSPFRLSSLYPSLCRCCILLDGMKTRNGGRLGQSRPVSTVIVAVVYYTRHVIYKYKHFETYMRQTNGTSPWSTYVRHRSPTYKTAARSYLFHSYALKTTSLTYPLSFCSFSSSVFLYQGLCSLLSFTSLPHTNAVI